MNDKSSLAQLRAKHALAEINELKEADIGNYVSYVKALPPTILMNGLGQAMATLLSGAQLANSPKQTTDEKMKEKLYRQISNWLCKDNSHRVLSSTHEDLMTALVESDEDYYLYAQAEALAYLEWLKKFANAFLEKGVGSNAASI